jgi:hypothetical protein
LGIAGGSCGVGASAAENADEARSDGDGDAVASTVDGACAVAERAEDARGAVGATATMADGGNGGSAVAIVGKDEGRLRGIAIEVTEGSSFGEGVSVARGEEEDIHAESAKAAPPSRRSAITTTATTMGTLERFGGSGEGGARLARCGAKAASDGSGSIGG